MTSMEHPYLPEQPNWLTRFLWHSAGADGQILSRCPKSDQVKYECLGGLVLSTSVLAFMSGGYAVYVAFSRKDGYWATHIDQNSVVAALVVGLFWSIVIYNLERFIVSSMGKVDDSGAITLSKLLRALPRIVLSIIVGTVLAAPLEVRVLEKEVQQKIMQEEASGRLEIQSQYDRDTNRIRYQDEYEKRFRDLARDERKVSDLELRVKKKQNNFALAEIAKSMTPKSALSADEQTTYGSLLDNSTNVVPRKVDRFLRTTKDELGDKAAGTGLLGELEATRKKVSAIRESPSFQKQLLDFERDFYGVPAGNRDLQLAKLQNKAGLVHQLKIIHSGDYSQIVIMLRLLLIIIETSPIFFKMMVSRSTYEVLLDSQQRISAAQQGVIRGGLVTLDGKLVSTSELSLAATAFESELRIRTETAAGLAAEIYRVFNERTTGEIRAHPEDFIILDSGRTSETERVAPPVPSPVDPAHTAGRDCSDSHSRTPATHPSAGDSGGLDVSVGHVGLAGATAGTTIERVHFSLPGDIERFTSGASLVETEVVGACTAFVAPEGTSPVHTTAPFCDPSDPRTVTLSVDEGTLSATPESEITGHSVAAITRVEPSSVTTQNICSDGFIATSDPVAEDLSEAEVVIPHVVSLEGSSVGFTVADAIYDGSGTDTAVAVSVGMEPSDTLTAAIDDSTTVESERIGTDSPVTSPPVHTSDESGVIADFDTTSSRLLDGVILSEGEVRNDESLLTTLRADNLPIDDTEAEQYPDTVADFLATRTPETHGPAE